MTPGANESETPAPSVCKALLCRSTVKIADVGKAVPRPIAISSKQTMNFDLQLSFDCRDRIVCARDIF
jgi:hypothetical protein